MTLVTYICLKQKNTSTTQDIQIFKTVSPYLYFVWFFLQVFFGSTPFGGDPFRSPLLTDLDILFRRLVNLGDTSPQIPEAVSPNRSL